MNTKLVAINLLTAAVGANGKEAAAGGVMATIGTAIAAYLGGWDAALRLLGILIVADYVTGLAGAYRQKNVNSEIMFWGGIRKGVVILVILMAVQLDQFFGNQAPIFRTIIMYFYIGREGLSVVENLGMLGVPFPTAITKALEQLQQKGGDAVTQGAERMKNNDPRH